MLTAKEAREYLNDLETNKYQKELATVEKKITEALKMGRSSCWLDMEISKVVELHLQILGYKIRKIEDPKDGNNVELKW